MKFLQVPLEGAYLIEMEPIEDDRGFFARTFCRDEMIAHGLNPDVAQCNISYNRRRGTIRGMHYQSAPHEETKIVQCIRGTVYDVIIDLRPLSATYRQWYGVELNDRNRKMLYIPHGFAHGFQTLEDDSEIFYQMGSNYVPEAARGIRWDDPAFRIEWPYKCEEISERDRNFEPFVDEV